MMDYLAGRQNVIAGVPKDELNAYLANLVAEFGDDWLAANAGNPIQELWQRRDALATNELLLLGEAIANMLTINAAWTRRQIAEIKSIDAGSRAGAIFVKVSKIWLSTSQA